MKIKILFNILTIYFYQCIFFVSCCTRSHGDVLFRRNYRTNVSTVLINFKAFVASSLITLNSSIAIRMGLNMPRCIKYSWMFPATE
jgi:hypothetical protein